MSEADALLQAIFDTPADDSPRLVYADWLDEHGERHHAELIRLQCEWERLSPADPRRRANWAGQNRVWRTCAEGWAWELWGLDSVDLVHFRRGFLETTLWVTLDWLVKRSAFWWPRLPVRSVCIADQEADAVELELFANSPALDRVEELGIPWLEGDAGVVTLTGSPYLSRLRVLRLEYLELGNRAARALARCPRLGGLRELYLRGSDIGDAGVEALADSPHLTSLALIDLQDNPVGRFAINKLRAQMPRTDVIT